MIEITGGRGIKSSTYDRYVHVHVHTEYTEVFRKRKCVTKLAGEESRVALRIPPRSRRRVCKKISCCANAAGLPVAM